jgi:adenylosuccinate synthase
VPTTVVVGTQWGDEGKGKLTDLLAAEAELVVRYQGGHNAGHTLVVDGEKFALRLTPSGVLNPGCTPLIANGVVVEPWTLLAELDGLAARGVDVSRLRVSGACHVILPWHAALDAVREAALGSAKLGTTLNGIGPAYADKAARVGLRIADLLDPEVCRERLTRAAVEKRALLGALGAAALGIDVEAVCDPEALCARLTAEIAPRIAPMVCDGVDLLHTVLERGGNVLCEGAQATFLDIDHGTYPFVTSSNPVAGAACVGAGMGPGSIDRVIGVGKAYITRVGAGPFPTELTDAVGDLIVERGHEFGTVTGRRRRPGWFDAVAMRHAVRLNGITELCITKLDVLDPLDEVRICVAYDIDGERTTRFPERVDRFARAVPVYETLPGWRQDITHVTTAAALPAGARAVIDRIAAVVGVPVRYVGTGPGRDQVVDLG